MSKRKGTPDIGSILSGQTESKPSEQQKRPLTKEEQKKETERQKIKRRVPHRATYDLPPGMKKEISDIAKELGTPASQVATFFLTYALNRFRDGELDIKEYLEPSTSLRWDHNIRYEDIE